MFQSKKANLIISLILAILLWMYIVGQMDPTTKKSFRSVPITITNEQSLADQGLAVINEGEETLSVSISGKRSDVSKIKITDIVATVDVSEAIEGDNRLKVNLVAPSDVEISDQSLSKINVEVQRRVSENIKVVPEFRDAPGGGKEPTVIAVEPEKVEVSGAAAQLKSVAGLKAVIPTEDVLEENESTVSVSVVPIDKDGNELRNLTLSRDTVKVTSIMHTLKSVKLEVPTKGKTKKMTLKAPEEISIKGTTEALQQIDKITAKEVDLSDVKKSDKIELDLNLPDGVYLSDANSKITLEVSVK